MLRTACLLVSSLLVAACSGGGSGSAASPAQPQPSGAVQLMIDTATGSPALVQVQVAAITLEYGNGTATANVLASPQMVTLADPTGAIEGLTLAPVADGDYRSVHLGVVPGSGVARFPDGTTVAVTTAIDLEIPLAEVMTHDRQRDSWLLCGHDGNAPPANAQSAFAWNPLLRGRTSGSPITLSDLDVAWVGSGQLTATSARLGGAPLHLELAPGCTLLDEAGSPFVSRAAFLAQVRRGQRVAIRGEVLQPGDIVVRQLRVYGNGRGPGGPRLMGRITSIDSVNASFDMDVFAESRRGGPAVMPLPSQARVVTAGASIHRSNGTPVAFGSLAVDQLVKVTWLTRIVAQNGPEEVTAEEIEVNPAGGVGNSPQWQGRVQSVDLVLRTLTIVPRGDPIVIRGVAQNPVTLHVDVGVPIQRHEPGRNGRTWIELPGVVGGQDRIWFCGTVTGPADLEASWLRVRDDS